MNREEAEYYLQSSGFSEEQIDTIEKAFTSTDAISRQAVRHILNHEVKMPIKVWKKVFELVDDLPPVTPQPKTEQFAKWVAEEILDEDWEYNKDSFAEIACRKLAKLGIVRAKGDEWELVEPQERSDKE